MAIPYIRRAVRRTDSELLGRMVFGTSPLSRPHGRMKMGISLQCKTSPLERVTLFLIAR